jgi:hypothetical protein
MTAYEPYDYRIYTRRRLSEPWRERPQMRCTRCSAHAGPRVGRAHLDRHYGRDDEGEHGPLQLLDHWVRVTAALPAGEEDIFYGVVVEQRRDEEACRQHWLAHDLKELLSRIRVVALWGERAGEERAVPVRPTGMNRETAAASPWGLRSLFRYHFAHPQRGQKCTDEEATDAAYVLGDEAPWTAWSILEHLLRVYCPRADVLPSSFCPIGFDLEAAPGVRETLEANEGEYQLFGLSLVEAIDRLIRDSGDLSWRVDWSEDGLHGPTFPRIQVFSRDYAGRVTPEAAVGSDEVLPTVIEDDGQNRVSEVWAFGGACRFMFTLRSDTTPGYEKAWSAELEAAWQGFEPEGLRYSLAQFGTVYRDYGIGSDADWSAVFQGPDLERYESEPGDLRSTEVRWRMDWYGRARPFSRANVVRFDRHYESQDDEAGTGLREEAVGPGQAPASGLQPLMGWLVGEDAFEGVTPLRVSPRSGASGFRVLDDPVDLMLDRGDRWQRMVVTGTVEGDWLLLAKARAEASDSDVTGIRFVFEPAYQWWAASPGTIVAVNPGARWEEVTSEPPQNCETVYGVIRNDYPKLLALAENTLRKFNAVKKAVRFRFKTLTTAWAPGDFVTEYNGHQIYAPVMSVVHTLTDDEGYGTAIQTLFSVE